MWGKYGGDRQATDDSMAQALLHSKYVRLQRHTQNK